MKHKPVTYFVILGICTRDGRPDVGVLARPSLQEDVLVPKIDGPDPLVTVLVVVVDTNTYF